MRILHLIDPASAGGGPCTLKAAAEAIARVDASHHDVVVIGNADHLALAWRCGLTPIGRIGAARNRCGFARRGLATLLRSYERTHGRYDLLHAWTPAGVLATSPRRRVVAFAGQGSCDRCAVDVLRRRGVPVLAADGDVARELHDAGCDAAQVAILPPGVDASTIDLEQRRLLREQWRADETTFVIGLLGEPPAVADGDLALSAAGRVALIGREVKVVLHHAAALPGGLRRWMGKLGIGEVPVIDDRAEEPWRIAAGLDAALLAPRRRAVPQRPHGRLARGAASALHWLGRDEVIGDPTALPALWAMAAGVPLIAARSGRLQQLLENGVTGLLFEPGDLHAIARHVVALLERPSARAVGPAGRALIEQRFRPDAFAAGLTTAWTQCRRDEPVRLSPEPSPVVVVPRSSAGRRPVAIESR